jgi:hypothetical protein
MSNLDAAPAAPTAAEVRTEAIRQIIAPAVAVAAQRDDVPLADNRAAVAEVTDALSTAMAHDPEAVNALSLEKPHQSRVTYGALVALALAVIGLIRFVIAETAGGFDFVTFDFFQFFTLLGGLGGASYVLYGRWFPNLKPLFWDSSQ